MMNIFYLLWPGLCALAVVFGYSRKANAVIKSLKDCIEVERECRKKENQELWNYIDEFTEAFKQYKRI